MPHNLEQHVTHSVHRLQTEAAHEVNDVQPEKTVQSKTKVEGRVTAVREKTSKQLEDGGEIHWEKKPRKKERGGMAWWCALSPLVFLSVPPPFLQPSLSSCRSTIPFWSKACSSVGTCRLLAPPLAAEVDAMPRHHPKLGPFVCGRTSRAQDCSGLHNEHARPHHIFTLRRQGIHPRPGTASFHYDDSEGSGWSDELHHTWEDELLYAQCEVPDQDGKLQDMPNARCNDSKRFDFFDDPTGDDWLQQDPDDLHLLHQMPAAQPIPGFVKAVKCIGSRQGMVFKSGPQGLGYYRDVLKLQLRLANQLPAVADSVPVQIGLSGLIPLSSEKENNEKHSTPETCPRRKKTSTGRRSEGEGFSIECPSDDSLVAQSKFHRQAGHWAFETANGRCWNTAAEYLCRTAADFVAL